jgi:hypothetical protein
MITLHNKHQNDVNKKIHTGVKLSAKQLNIFRIGCQSTQYFWSQSLI